MSAADVVAPTPSPRAPNSPVATLYPGEQARPGGGGGGGGVWPGPTDPGGDWALATGNRPAGADCCVVLGRSSRTCRQTGDTVYACLC